MIDVTHDSDHRWSRNQLGSLCTFVLDDVCLGIIELGGLRRVAHFLDQDDRRLLIENLIDRDHRTELHQDFYDFSRLHGHLVGQFTDRNRLRHRNFAHYRLDRRTEGRYFDLCVPRLVTTSASMPAGYAAARIASRLDHPAARRVVLEDGRGFRLLGLLVRLGRIRCAQLGLVQRPFCWRSYGGPGGSLQLRLH